MRRYCGLFLGVCLALWMAFFSLSAQLLAKGLDDEAKTKAFYDAQAFQEAEVFLHELTQEKLTRDKKTQANSTKNAPPAKTPPPPVKTEEELRQEALKLLSENKIAQALIAWRRVMASNPKDEKNFMIFAQASLNAQDVPANRKDSTLRDGQAAAYLAYFYAKDNAEEGDSLALLGKFLNARARYRSALRAYKLSLSRTEDAELRTQYDQLRLKYGFRVLSYEVESDSSTPRACFTFSEELSNHINDFTPYVTIIGQGAFAVRAQEKSICVDGLRHGEAYKITLRQGIRAQDNDEKLVKDVFYDFYVRDRVPSVRAHNNKAYVLPRLGQEGLPFISVNTDQLKIRVLRVGERNLIHMVQEGHFLNEIEPWKINQLADVKGEEVWKGTLSVTGELNKETVTAFPITEAVGALKSGVYVAFAELGNTGETAAAQNSEEEGYIDESSTNFGVQWFVVSDLGLTAFTGGDGIHVFVRRLSDAQPEGEVNLRLLAKNNEVLSQIKTNTQGYAHFERGLIQGQGGLTPGMIIAELKGDNAFINLQQSAFDLTDRGDSGRQAPNAMEAFLYTERGVYRPGENVYITALLRDLRGVSLGQVPLTLVVTRPDGMEYQRVVAKDEGAGGRSFNLALHNGVATGTWQVAAYADNKRPPLHQISFLVEDYNPERLALEIKSKKPVLRADEKLDLGVNVRYLYGANGAGLGVSGQVNVRRAASSAISGLADYVMGDAQQSSGENEIQEIPSQTTDKVGNTNILQALTLPKVNAPLEAKITLTASENGGRGITRSLTLPILPNHNVLALKPHLPDGLMEGEKEVRFDLLYVTPEGKRLSRAVKWKLSRIQSGYQWFFKNNRWSYEHQRHTRLISGGEVVSKEEGVIPLSVKLGLGRYRIEVVDPQDQQIETIYEFSLGFGDDEHLDTPDRLDLTLSQKTYNPGETLRARLKAPFAGQATLLVISDRLVHQQIIDFKQEGTDISIPVQEDWGSQAYLVVLAHRPLDQKAKRMPGRAIGLGWFSIGDSLRKLDVVLKTPPETGPRSQLALPLEITNFKQGEDVFFTLQMVDSGILSLTNYEAPKPAAYFFGKKRLSGELRDLYGFLIDGMQGKRGAIRSGGDGAALFRNARPNQPPMVYFSGVTKVGADGKVVLNAPLPAFNGRAKIIAIAWSSKRIGQAETDIIIRDPVVLQVTAPRFLLNGDQTSVFVEVDNVSGVEGEYNLNISGGGAASIQKTDQSAKIALKKGQRTGFSLPLLASDLGDTTFEFALKDPNGVVYPQNLTLSVLPAAYRDTERRVVSIAPGESFQVSKELMNRFVASSGQVAVNISAFPALNVSQMVDQLSRYPYGCTEQTVSKAMPLLDLALLGSPPQLGVEDPLPARINLAVQRVLSRQYGSGSFALWSTKYDTQEDVWLDAFTTDFLTRAREKNYNVPPQAFRMALDYLRNQVTNVSDVSKENAAGVAYALYVLAKNGRPILGDLRYLAENKLDVFATPLAKGQIGAALALLGDKLRAEKVFAEAEQLIYRQGEENTSSYRQDYGSALRDHAGLVALMVEGQAPREKIEKLTILLDQAIEKKTYFSTQEQTFMLMAAASFAKKTGENITLELAGQTHQGAYYALFPAVKIDQTPFVIKNTGVSPLRMSLAISGLPLTPPPAADNVFSITRKFYSMKGEEVSTSKLQQNTRYIVQLEVTPKQNREGRLMVVDPLPSGVEIENPRLSGASLEGLPFVKGALQPEHSEARDDRFFAAIAVSDSKKSFKLVYMVRAVRPGRFVYPSAFVEDMYRPERFGRSAPGFSEIVSARPNAP